MSRLSIESFIDCSEDELESVRGDVIELRFNCRTQNFFHFSDEVHTIEIDSSTLLDGGTLHFKDVLFEKDENGMRTAFGPLETLKSAL